MPARSTPLTALVRPHVAIITTVAPVHLEFFGSVEAIADAKAEIFRGPRARRRGGAQPRQSAVRAARATRARSAASARIVSFGEHAERRCAADQVRAAGRTARPCRRASSAPTSPTSSARPGGISCSIRSPCWPRRRSPAPISRSRRWRSPSCSRPTGRGARITLDVPGGTALLIDESYNANPASMRAALALLGQAELGAARPAHRGARRHAGTRPAAAPTCIAALAEPIVEQRGRSGVLLPAR